IGSVANIGWLLPNANQAFRVTVFRTFSQGLPAKGENGLPAKGENELTFAELDRLIERHKAFPVGSDERNDVIACEPAITRAGRSHLRHVRCRCRRCLSWRARVGGGQLPP